MKLVDAIMKRARKMTVFDYSLFKTVVVVLGMIFGAYCADFVKENIIVFWVVFGVLYVLLIYRVYLRKQS